MGIIVCAILLVILLILTYTNKAEFSTIILIGLLVRMALMIVSLTDLFPLLHDNGDSQGFHNVAMLNQSGHAEIVYTHYSVFLTRLYAIFINDNPRMIAQFINVMFGTGIIIIVRHCLTILGISYKTRKQAMWLMALLPNLAIFSAILVREAWIEFFVALSMLFFIKWFLQRGNAVINILICILSVFIASYMHAGVIGFAMGYLIAFTMYNPAAKAIKISFFSVFTIALAVVAVMIFMSNMSVWGGKFANVEMDDEFVDEHLMDVNGRGGSNYMTWLHTSSMLVGILALPIRMFLFLCSPVPPFWRGFNDVFAFACDGFIYLYLIWNILRAKICNLSAKRLRAFLLSTILIVTVIFAFGTGNAGTAMRHRAKYLSVILVTYCVVRDNSIYEPKRKKS